jgi:hypothetical protein
MSTQKHQHHETLNFTRFPDYYGAMSGQDGYGGFNYSGLVEYLNAIWWENIDTYWCDTGYQNVAAATGATAVAYIYEYGTFTSANPKETFDLKSFVAAAAWSANMEWQLSTYSAKGIHTMDFYVTDAPGTTAQLIKVSNAVGHAITGFNLLMLNAGTGGNTCTSTGGYSGGIVGYQIAFGDMKITWNGKIPHGGGHSLLGHSTHAHHHATPAPLHSNNLASTPAAHGTHASGHTGAPAYHTQLLAFGHDPGGLTREFNLPQTEHFGL